MHVMMERLPENLLVNLLILLPSNHELKDN